VVLDVTPADLVAQDAGEQVGVSDAVGLDSAVGAAAFEELVEGEPVLALSAAAAAGRLSMFRSEAVGVGGAAGSLALGGFQELLLAPGGVVLGPPRSRSPPPPAILAAERASVELCR